MRLTFATALAVGSLLSLAACHAKSVKVQPPLPTAAPAKPSWELALDKADNAFVEAKYDVATVAYDEYLRYEPSGRCQQRDHALFRQAIINSVPEYLPHNSAKAVGLLKEVANCSGSPLRPEAQLFLRLYDNIDQLAIQREDQNRQVLQLKSQLEVLSAQLAEDAPVSLAAGDCSKEIPDRENKLKAPRVDRRDQLLFELGVYYSLTTCRLRNADKSSLALKQVDEKSPFGPPAKAMLALNGQIEKLSMDLEKQSQKAKDLSSQLDKLKEIDTKRPRR
jgi:hypothetical protein